jgi:hypothetical protein
MTDDKRGAWMTLCASLLAHEAPLSALLVLLSALPASLATRSVSALAKKAPRAALSGRSPGRKSATADAFCAARDASGVIAGEKSVTHDAFRDEGW